MFCQELKNSAPDRAALTIPQTRKALFLRTYRDVSPLGFLPPLPLGDARGGGRGKRKIKKRRALPARISLSLIPPRGREGVAASAAGGVGGRAKRVGMNEDLSHRAKSRQRRVCHQPKGLYVIRATRYVINPKEDTR